MDNDTITFFTSDEPPQLLTISRISLIAGSIVFRDMLSLPSQDSSQPIPLSEKAEELKPLLLVIGGDDVAVKWAADVNWSSKEWQALALLADKYDVASARHRIEIQICEVATCWTPFHACDPLQDTELIERTARRAVRLPDHEISRTLLSEEWKQRLRRWKPLVAISTFKALKSGMFTRLEHNHRGCGSDKDPQDIWYRLISESVAGFSVESKTPLPLLALVSKTTFCCEDIKAKALEKAEGVESDVWRQLKLPLDY